MPALTLNKSNLKTFLIVISAAIIPGAGHVILKLPARGLKLIMWMFFLGYITFHLLPPDIPLISRLSGGTFVWLLSIIDVYKICKKIY